MGYTEKLKYSVGYNWGISREIWDIFTLRNWHWLIIGLLVVFSAVPMVLTLFTPPQIGSYPANPLPTFAPSLSQELAITKYCFIERGKPPFLLKFNYYLIRSSGFKTSSGVLSSITVVLVMAAYLREGSPVRGREE